jgi:PIN domain nuclease of toxin-antitoxin system
MLIDTNALIWYALQPDQLSRRAAKVIREKNNFYSHVSLWEMAIKSGLGKLQLRGPNGQRASAKQFLLQMVRDLQLSAVPLEFDDLADVEDLPQHHKDPFDRLLVVQARRCNLAIVSPDQYFDAYGVRRVW